MTLVFFTSAVAVLATSYGIGPFVGNSLHESFTFLQIFMGVLSITGMFFAAIAAERNRLEERKDELISITSHELKTPITTIKGYTEILGQFIRGERELLYLSKMNEQIDRLTKLVNDLLDVSKIQAGKLQYRKEMFRLDELARQTIEDMQRSIPHKIIFEGETVPVKADKNRISEVLANLISNAAKYSPKARKIYVRVSRDSSLVTASVQDFGIGIARKDMDNIFKRYYRAENRSRQNFSGLGLGLYITSEIVKQHNGKIWAKSVKGRGTTVSFSLPVN